MKNIQLTYKKYGIGKKEFKLKKILLTYKEYGILVNELVSKITVDDFDSVYGVNRGGLPMAVHLSHFLNKPLNYMPYFDINPYSLLVVDDIIDTGETMIKYRWISKYTASLFWKPHSEFKPDFYVKETTDWIVFPWEKNDEVPNREMYKNLK